MQNPYVRRAVALALAMLLCMSIIPVQAETYPTTAYTTASLRLRQLPSTSSAILLTMPAGDMAIIIGESGDFYIAIYNGVQGYAQKQYLRLVSYTPGAQQQTASPSVYAALTTGSQGTEVSALQGALKELGFYTSSVDGQYGPGTRSAVLAFQKANGLAQTGIADSATQTLLYEGVPYGIKGKMMSVTQVSPISGAPIQMGSTGEAVRNLQLRLKELGYYLVTVDGVAGNSTVNAIKAFQKKNGLSQSGVADSDTQTLLYSAFAVPSKATAAPQGAPTPTPYPTNAPVNGNAVFPFITHTTSSVNLRAEASTASARLLTIPKGAEITVLAISGDYLRVTYSGKTGYIVSEYAVVPSQYAPGSAMNTDTDAQQKYAYLQSGSMGKNVSVLQEALKELGFYNGALDGSFGVSTVTAVKAFQKKNNIKQDGIASPEVQKLIFEGTPLNAKGKKTNVKVLPNTTVEELKQGDKGDQVADLQSRLHSLGLYSGSFTGTFDTATVSAVKNFQRQHSLSVDGVAGPKTLRLLYLLSATPAPTQYVMPYVTPVPLPTPITAQNVTVLGLGSRGDQVIRLQNRLMELGYYTCVPDGVYDADEINAVREFQRKNGLSIDGIAGLYTQQVLYSASALPATTVPLYGQNGFFGPTPTPIVLSTPLASLQVLKPGSSGELVMALQTKLKQLGYYTGTVDGQYGPGTQQAVTKFQRANGLSADGVAGTQTLNKLYTSGNPVAAPTPVPTATPKSAVPAATQAPISNTLANVSLLRSGDTGAAVKELQQRLVALGYLSSADGIYGPKTYNAVVSFQKRNGLTADGVAGKMTLNRLNSANAVAAVGNPVLGNITPSNPNQNANLSATFNAPSASQVQYANWFSVIRSIAKKMPDVVIYDPDSGLHFNLHMFSFGKHADSETPTAADTAVLNQVVGFNSWTPKYVWVLFPDGQVFIASIHSHGHEVDHTPNNDLEGHICLHFPRVMSEAEQTGPYAVSHQKEINWGWELTQAMVK